MVDVGKGVGGASSEAHHRSVRGAVMPGTWQGAALMGAVTLVLGIVVAVNPSTSINVVAVLIGVLVVISGLFHLIRALDRDATSRGWTAVIGIAFVVLGVLLIRHLHLTRALIALVVGLVWIAQGVAELVTAADGDQPGRAWSLVFGIISVAGGVVVLSFSTASLNALAVLLGVWFIAMGILELAGAFYLRRLADRRT